MEQNPLEQEKTNKAEIAIALEELRLKVGNIFDDKTIFEEGVDKLSVQLDYLQKNGFISNKEKIIEDFRKCLEITNREEFTSCFVELFKPILLLKFSHPHFFEKMQREIQLDGQVKLSEVLVGEISEKEAQIHLATARELIKEEGMGNFKKEVENGLIKLAEIIKDNNSIEKVTATSWIVAKNPMLLEKLGFIIIGEISKEEKEGEEFKDEKRPVARAFMNREDFLNKYNKN